VQLREDSEDCDIVPDLLPKWEKAGLPKWEWANGHYRGDQAGDKASSQSNKFKDDIYYRHYGHRDIKVFQFSNDNICYSDYRLKIRKNWVYFTDPMRSRRDPDEPRASAALRRLKPRVMQTERKRKPKKRGIRNPERKGDRRKKLAEQLKLRRKRNKEKPTTPCTDLGEPVQGNILFSSQEPHCPKDNKRQNKEETGQIILKNEKQNNDNNTAIIGYKDDLEHTRSYVQPNKQ